MDDGVEHVITFSLLTFLHIVVLSNGLVDARSTADADAEGECHDNCSKKCDEKKEKPVEEVEETVAC